MLPDALPASIPNRRRASRVRVDLPARATAGTRVHHFRVRDLSLGGALLEGASLPLGARIDLRIDLGGERPLRATGEVVTGIGRSGTGVAFSSIPTKDLVRLAEAFWGRPEADEV